MKNTVQNKDWLKNNLPDKSIDLIIADPPYFEVKGDFDFIWSSFEDYLKDVEKWAIECKRLLKDNGTLFWYGDDKRIAYAQIIFDKYFDLLNNITWNKGENFMGLNNSEVLRSFAPCTERILMYSKESFNLTNCVYHIRDYIRGEIIKSKGKIILKHVNEALGTATNGGGVASACLSLDKLEPAMITKEMYLKLQNWCAPYLKKEYEELRKEYEEQRRYFNNNYKLNEVFRFNNESGSHSTNYQHPTIKPEKLTRVLIQTCSRKNATVLIPFAGSGTECAMSLKEGRIFYGFEIEPKYVEIANKRINKIKKNPELF